MEYINNGARVFAVDSNMKALKRLLPFGINLSIHKADVSSSTGIRNIVNKAIRIYKRIDVLVNAAAIQTPIGKLTDINVRSWEKTIRTNLIGTMLCCKHIIPFMIKQKKGKIINFSGGGATFPRVNFSAYACSKAAIVRLTEILAKEYIHRNIDINAIAPGPVYSTMIEQIIRGGERSGIDDYKKALKIKNSGKYPAKPTSDLAVFLAGNESDGITGKLISSIWDDWQSFKSNKNGLADSPLYTLRRIDGHQFLIK